MAADDARIVDRSGNAKRQFGVGGALEETGGALPFFIPEVTGRFGLTERWEVAAMLSPLRLAAETRLGILAERRRNPFSLALAFAGGYQPFFQRSGPWLRAGVDISRQTRHFLFMTNFAVTYGSEAHAFALHLPPRPDDSLMTDGVAQHAQVTQREIRFMPSLAMGVRISSGYLMVGIVPWFVVHGWAPDYLHCDGCLSGYRVNDFRESFGASLVVGGAFRKGY